MLLPRLYVWSGLIYLWRGSDHKAKEYFDEAWKLAGAEKAGSLEGAGDRALDLFGGEISSNAASFFAAGLKGREKEELLEENAQLREDVHRAPCLVEEVLPEEQLVELGVELAVFAVVLPSAGRP